MNAVVKMRHALHSTRVSDEAEVKAGPKGWRVLRKVLLVCGILSSLLYGAMIGAIRFEGYSPISQTVSELSAIGAPTRPLWMLLGSVYDMLVVAFGVGVWVSAGGKRALRAVGGLLVASWMLGLAWPFASMHQRELLAAGEGTLSDTLHIILGMVTVLFMLVAIGFGATAFGKRFRLYSIATILILLVFGALTGLDGPRIAANLPTPWVGVWERINILGFLLWVLVLAIALLRVEGTTGVERSWPRRDETLRSAGPSSGGHEEMAERKASSATGVSAAPTGRARRRRPRKAER